MPRFFISYSRDDRRFVTDFVPLLLPVYGNDSVWFDHQIPGGVDWWEMILSEVRRCDIFIYLLSNDSLISPYCRDECREALRLGKQVLPVVVRPKTDIRANLPDDLRDLLKLQYIDLSSIDPSATTRLHAAIRTLETRLAQNPAPRSEPIVSMNDAIVNFYQANSQGHWGAAREWLAKIRQIGNAPSFFDLDSFEKVILINEVRDQQYDVLKIMGQHDTPRRVWDALQIFWQSYPNYDPDNLARFAPTTQPPVAPRFWSDDEVKSALERGDTVPADQMEAWMNRQLERGLQRNEDEELLDADIPTVQAELPSWLIAAVAKPLTSLELMPKPFEWMDIPAGQVKLRGGGYVPKGGQTFPVDAFKIAKYPITNAQFDKYIKAKGYENQAWWTANGWRIKEKEGWIEPLYWQDKKWNQPDYPVVGVSWYEAVAFCFWLSEATGEKILLPSEQEWQWAAQGDTGWAYPWGNAFDKSRCNVESKGTTPTTQYPTGTSPFGVMDMSGNVWEWCSTGYETGSTDLRRTDVRVVRGGSFIISRSDAHTAYRSFVRSGNRYNYLGFRVVCRPPSLGL